MSTMSERDQKGGGIQKCGVTCGGSDEIDNQGKGA